MTKNSVSMKIYHLYQLDWMQRHGFSLDDLVAQLTALQREDLANVDPDDIISVTDLPEVSALWCEFDQNGFNGELYESYSGFMTCEYLEQDYIKELCDVSPDGKALYEAYGADIEKMSHAA